MLIAAFVVLAAKQTPSRLPPDNAVTQWIKENAHPLRTSVAETGFEDLQAFKGIIGTARVVSMGEATHGTRENFQMKHRMLEFLVKEMGFTTFTLESSYPACLAINAYVMDGVGDPEKALDGQGFWTCGSLEMLDMIKWMRRYNADPNSKRKISFYGVDNNQARKGAEIALDALALSNPRFRESLAPFFEMLPKDFSEKELLDPTDAEWAKKMRAMKPVLAALDHNRSAIVGKIGERRFEEARQCAVVVQQTMQMNNLMRAYPLAFIRTGATPSPLYWGGFDRSSAYLRQLIPKVSAKLAIEMKAVLHHVGLIIPYADIYRAYRSPGQRELLKAHTARILNSSDEIIAVAPDPGRAKAALDDLGALFPFLDRYATRRAQTPSYSEFRDRCMADNTLWALKQAGRRGRAMTWAHNGHVHKGKSHDLVMYEKETRRLGTWLTEKLHKDHLVIGFSTMRGSLQAHAGGQSVNAFGAGLKGMRFAPSPAGSFDWSLSQADLPMLYLDLRRSNVPEVARWLDRKQLTRYVGSTFDALSPNWGFAMISPRKAYDVVIFQEETSRAIPTAKTRAQYKITSLEPVNP